MEILDIGRIDLRKIGAQASEIAGRAPEWCGRQVPPQRRSPRVLRVQVCLGLVGLSSVSPMCNYLCLIVIGPRRLVQVCTIIAKDDNSQAAGLHR